MKVKQIVAMLALAGVAGLAHAQTYPSKQVTILCWSAAGSPVDIYARTLAKLLTPELGQNVVVENRTGGSGIVMVNTLVRGPADGYTIAANTLSLATLFSEKTAQFKVEDLQMVARSQIDPYGLIVHTSTPFKNLEQFVAFARKKPEYLNVGGPFAISSHRVAWEVFSDVVQDRLGTLSRRRPGADGDCRRPHRRRGDQSRQRQTDDRCRQGARAGGVFRKAAGGFS